MLSPLPYIIISILVLFVVVVFVVTILRDRSSDRLTPLAGLAFGFIIAGILFGGNRTLGYSLIGVGVLLALIDIFRSQRAGQRSP
jgi:hypothetical protein